MKQHAMHPAVGAFMIVLLALWTGCEDKMQNHSGEEHVNPNLPNANELIVHQVTFGDADYYREIVAQEMRL